MKWLSVSREKNFIKTKISKYVLSDWISELSKSEYEESIENRLIDIYTST
jgi:hypothetical protein